MYPYTSNSEKKTNIKAAQKDFPEPLNDSEDITAIFTSAITHEAEDAAKYAYMANYFDNEGLSKLSNTAKSISSDENRHKALLL